MPNPPTHPTAAASVPASRPSPEFAKLRDLLTELFQLDAAEDLDFGMYRVLRLRRAAIDEFLQVTLVDQVRQALGSGNDHERASLEAQLSQMDEQARRFGGRADADPEYQKLRAVLDNTGSAESRERQVYAHLWHFFSRYYEDGDFISLPRYRANTYAIPYDGSEVVLHWANKDQYYVKSGEYFARYAFALADQRRVVFRLADAETDPDHVKSADAGKRRFVLQSAQPVQVEGGELVIRFEYRPAEGKQTEVNADSVARVLALSPPEWRHELDAPQARKAGKEEVGMLAWHLRQYTEKNKRDYFIHKDLGGFLRREIDHYLKTEVFDLDSVELMAQDQVESALMLVKTIRAAAKPLITFLHSMEDFQKRLFLKKKMVLSTDWCISLDRVSEEFYAEIALNERQIQRWKELYAIDEIPPVLGDDATGATVSVEFLKRNRGLLVETRLFKDNPTFVSRLLESLPGLDQQVTGVLVRGSAVAAMRQLRSSRADSIDMICTDPLYNTGEDSFAYKDGFCHSSWLSDQAAALAHARGLLRESGSLWATLDDHEQGNFIKLAAHVFGPEHLAASIVWQKRTSPDIRATLGAAHDYLNVIARNPDAFRQVRRVLPASEARKSDFKLPDGDPNGPWASVDLTGQTGHATPSQFEDLVAPDGRRFEVPSGRCWAISQRSFTELWNQGRIWLGANGDARPRQKRYLSELAGVPAWTWWPNAECGTNEDGRKELLRMNVSADGQTPKPVELYQRILTLGAPEPACEILDFFAGSGTTGHAVLNLNRADGGNRRFILIEVNDYFDTVLVPRILKASYSDTWKDGKPQDRKQVPGGALYKVMYLESYEDTLANITLPPPPSDNPLPFALHADYTIRYMLGHETQSAVLDLDRFRKPFSWTMEVRRGGLVTKDHPVDLVETFNYLIGLHVSRCGFLKNPNELRYVEGIVKEQGTNLRVLVMWRDCEAVNDERLVNLFNNREFAPVRSREFDRIYVNGDPPLENVRRDDEQWKVLAIEDEFKRLSFADDEV